LMGGEGERKVRASFLLPPKAENLSGEGKEGPPFSHFLSFCWEKKQNKKGAGREKRRRDGML